MFRASCVGSGFLVASLEEGEDCESVFAELDGEGEEDWLSEVGACPQAVHDKPIRNVRNRDTAFFIVCLHLFLDGREPAGFLEKSVAELGKEFT